MSTKVNFRRVLGKDGDTSLQWATLPEAPARGDFVVLDGNTWRVGPRTWLIDPHDSDEAYCVIHVERI